MKFIKLKSRYASPRGSYEPGTVLGIGPNPGQIPLEEADQLIEGRYAVPLEDIAEGAQVMTKVDAAFLHQKPPTPGEFDETQAKITDTEDQELPGDTEEIVNPTPKAKTKPKAKAKK